MTPVTKQLDLLQFTQDTYIRQRPYPSYGRPRPQMVKLQMHHGPAIRTSTPLDFLEPRHPPTIPNQLRTSSHSLPRLIPRIIQRTNRLCEGLRHPSTLRLRRELLQIPLVRSDLSHSPSPSIAILRTNPFPPGIDPVELGHVQLDSSQTRERRQPIRLAHKQASLNRSPSTQAVPGGAVHTPYRAPFAGQSAAALPNVGTEHQETEHAPAPAGAETSNLRSACRPRRRRTST